MTNHPRIRDLPEPERAPFEKWLTGQTCPWLDGVAKEEQDAYFPWDYTSWRRTKFNKGPEKGHAKRSV